MLGWQQPGEDRGVRRQRQRDVRVGMSKEDRIVAQPGERRGLDGPIAVEGQSVETPKSSHRHDDDGCVGREVDFHPVSTTGQPGGQYRQQQQAPKYSGQLRRSSGSRSPVRETSGTLRPLHGETSGRSPTACGSLSWRRRCVPDSGRSPRWSRPSGLSGCSATARSKYFSCLNHLAFVEPNPHVENHVGGQLDVFGQHVHVLLGLLDCVLPA